MRKIAFLFTMLFALASPIETTAQAPITATNDGLPPAPPAIQYGFLGTLVLGTFWMQKNIIDKLTVAVENNTRALSDIEKTLAKLETKNEQIQDDINQLKSLNLKQ